jgi:hypothetical protein
MPKTEETTNLVFLVQLLFELLDLLRVGRISLPIFDGVEVFLEASDLVLSVLVGCFEVFDFVCKSVVLRFELLDVCPETGEFGLKQKVGRGQGRRRGSRQSRSTFREPNLTLRHSLIGR